MRLLLGTVALTAVVLFGAGPGSATATIPQGTTTTDTSWTQDKPLTGRAIPCDRDKIKIFDCHNVELLSYLPRSAIGNTSGFDMWGWHDSATGREFAVVGGHSGGTTFVEVTDPLNPKYLGILPMHVKESGGEAYEPSVKVYKYYAFIGYERTKNHGLQVFDLTRLRNVQNAPVTFEETAYYDKFTRTHTLALNPETGFAYANGGNSCGGGMHMVDVRTPTKPTFAGCYTGVYVHDAQCVLYRGPDRQYKGREICVIYTAGAGLSIVDVTDKQHPKAISTATYPNVGFTHQGWFTKDQRYIFLNDEGDEGGFLGQRTVEHTRTIGFDLSDLDDPVLLTEFFNTATTTTDHNLYIRGRYMYQGNNEAGLRIIDIADPKQLKEVGYFSGPKWAWGTYPFFKNDVVAVPMSSGLFLVRLLKR